MSEIKLVCVLGRTSSGKDTLVKNVTNKDDLVTNIGKSKILTNVDKYVDISSKFKTIVSYTTRPIRPTEVNNREHIFISEEDFQTKFIDKRRLAYTMINGYRYFTLIEQVSNLLDDGYIPIYIIDPIGFNSIIDYHTILGRDYLKRENIYSIYIAASKQTRMERYLNRGKSNNIDNKDLLNDFNARNASENAQFTEFEHDMFDKRLVDKIIINESPEQYYQNIISILLSFYNIYNGYSIVIL